jgi:hypothetical protein
MLEDQQYLVKILRGRFRTKLQRTNIFRIMCVAKNYDASLLDRELLKRLMTRELKENLKIDLILEEGGHEFDILPSP